MRFPIHDQAPPGCLTELNRQAAGVNAPYPKTHVVGVASGVEPLAILDKVRRQGEIDRIVFLRRRPNRLRREF